MKTTIKQIICSVLYYTLLFTTDVSIAQDNDQPVADQIAATQFFQTIAIHEVNGFKTKQGTADRLIEKKVVLQSVSYKPNLTKSKIMSSMHPKIPEYGQILWVITAAQLPVTEENCLAVDSLLCHQFPLNSPHQAACHKPCIMYGPEFIAFDEKTGKLYLSTKTEAGGNAGWPLFGFVADVNTREIKLLKIFEGPISAHLSPSGTYLAMCGNKHITIVNTHTSEDFTLIAKDLPIAENNLYILDQLQWLNDSQFKYYTMKYHSKFQKKPDSIVGKVFDLKTRKIINEFS